MMYDESLKPVSEGTFTNSLANAIIGNIPAEEIDKLISQAMRTIEEHKDDPVNHPSHYTRGKIEVADFIDDQGLNKNAWLAMAVKYICRAGYKDPLKYTEDLRKAVWYINREITRYEKDAEEHLK